MDSVLCCPQLMLVVKCPSGSTLTYTPSIHATLLDD